MDKQSKCKSNKNNKSKQQLFTAKQSKTKIQNYTIKQIKTKLINKPKPQE